MKLFLVSLAIVLSAALIGAPLTAESASITLKPSPTTLALSPVDSAGCPTGVCTELHVTNVTVNGGAITAPVPHGSSVDVEFDWSMSAVPGCPGCIIQLYVGFQGKPGACVVAHGSNGASGHGSVTLTAPSLLGNALIMLNETLQLGCIAVTSGGGGLGSIMGIAVVK